MRISAGLTSFALSICIFALGEQICNVQPVHAQEVAKQFALCKSYQYKYSVNFCQNDGYACYGHCTQYVVTGSNCVTNISYPVTYCLEYSGTARQQAYKGDCIKQGIATGICKCPSDADYGYVGSVKIPDDVSCSLTFP